MIFRQLFDSVSGTYSYLLASRAGGEAMILDPVLERVDRYCQLLRELDLRLVKAVDTHLHADHVTGLGELRDRTHCVTIMGEQSKADVVAMRVADGDKVMIEGLGLEVMYTPGHTDDSYSYLLASRPGGEALIIDPVLEKVDRYLQLTRELDLRLVKAVDTHLHADHVTGLGELRDRTHCVTIMGEQSKADVVAMRVADGDKVTIEGLCLDVMYTPGHTDDSYSYLMGDRVFTGDTLLIRGTGRTDFQNGSARAQYDSIFGRLLKLPDDTMVFPAHDYKGDTVSTIGEEKRFNPRLQVRDADEYAKLMESLHLPNPKMMDVAVPANIHQGLHQEDVARKGWAFSAEDAQRLLGRPDVTMIDLREKRERERTGAIPSSLHAPYGELQDNIGKGGLIHELVRSGKTILFYCAFGERSAMAVQAAQDQGLASARHIEGGMSAWTKAGGATH